MRVSHDESASPDAGSTRMGHGLDEWGKEVTDLPGQPSQRVQGT